MKIDSNKKLKKFFREEFQTIRDQNLNTRKVSTYSGEIGSTKLEDIPYELQLDIKRKALSSILGIDSIEIVPSPKIERYRYKMEFVCSFDPFHEPNNRFGQRKEKRFNWVVDLEDCILVPKEWFHATRKLYEFLLSKKIELYDLVSFKGNLRYLVLRNFKNQATITVVSKTKLNQELREETWEQAKKLGFKGIDFIINPTQTDITTGEFSENFGDTDIQVELLEKSFYVGSENFFQNNISGFEFLAEYVKTLLKKIPEENTEYLYDLYCGVGTLGILFSDQFRKIIGIDIVEKNIEYLEKNLKLNSISNYKYSTEDLNKKDLELEIHSNQTLIVDPPRSGLQKNGVQHILKLNPEYIIYISCNPITQQQDMLELAKKYKVLEAKAFDLFPLTYHMENVLLLKRFI